jgi:hypothetical protein
VLRQLAGNVWYDIDASVNNKVRDNEKRFEPDIRQRASGSTATSGGRPRRECGGHPGTAPRQAAEGALYKSHIRKASIYGIAAGTLVVSTACPGFTKYQAEGATKHTAILSRSVSRFVRKGLAPDKARETLSVLLCPSVTMRP